MLCGAAVALLKLGRAGSIARAVLELVGLGSSNPGESLRSGVPGITMAVDTAELEKTGRTRVWLCVGTRRALGVDGYRTVFAVWWR